MLMLPPPDAIYLMVMLGLTVAYLWIVTSPCMPKVISLNPNVIYLYAQST